MNSEILKKAGYKLTKPRQMVLDVLSNNHKPLSAKSIHELAAESVDMVSIYRTLNLLQELDVVYKDRVKDSDLYYLAEKRHHHVVCRECGYSECIPCDHIFSNVKNFKNISHNLSISGVCQNCD